MHKYILSHILCDCGSVNGPCPCTKPITKMLTKMLIKKTFAIFFRILVESLVSITDDKNDSCISDIDAIIKC